jgi:hypothetical protein
MATRARMLVRIRKAEQLSKTAKIRKAEQLLKTAKKEIANLLGEVNRGTLNRRILKSGLRKVTRTLAKMPPHSPPHWPHWPHGR